MLNPKVSVIMASYLLPYPGSRSNPDKKFIRAVNSFKKQIYQNKELVIVSDGCPLTVDLYNKYFSNDSNIKLLQIPKQQLYSGEMRNAALNLVDGDIISYLDTDDVLGPKHLQTIVDQFDMENYDFVFYNDYMVLDPTFKKLQLRIVEPRWASIGTSSVSHKNLRNVSWSKSGGYGHDFLFVFNMASQGLRYKKLEKVPEYLVCHYYNGDF